MAAVTTSLDEELCCSVCSDFYKDPVVLKCSHSFCRVCVQQYWEHSRRLECPLCRRKSSVENPPPNLALRNIVELYLKKKSESESAGQSKDSQKSEDCCGLHGEKLLLFCQDDLEPICVVCLTKHHRKHQVCPVEEAAVDLKNNLKATLKTIKEKFEKFITVKQESEETVKHITNQSQLTERQIREQFDKLHQFLRDEEEARLAALREEEEQKSLIMKEKIEHISKHISTLSDKIRDIEKVIDTEVSFLQMYMKIKKRAPVTLQDPEPVSGALIDVAKHLGSLKFRVWEKMQGIMQYTPVTLDPNTAYATLSLSDDLTIMRNTGVEQQLPHNPERFDSCPCVLGSEGLKSGKHSWEVEVGDKTEWDIGVAEKSVNRKEKIHLDPKCGFWTVILRNGDEYYAGTSPWSRLTLRRQPQRIRVQLDYDRGEVSFYDPSDRAHIYTFQHTFSETLYPFFSPCGNKMGSNPGALKICPVKVFATEISSQ